MIDNDLHLRAIQQLGKNKTACMHAPNGSGISVSGWSLRVILLRLLHLGLGGGGPSQGGLRSSKSSAEASSLFTSASQVTPSKVP